MTTAVRNHVKLQGSGASTIVFAHGFGCDQNMWRLITPEFTDRFRVLTFDLVGAGNSDLNAYDSTKYGTLEGYADDLLEIVREQAFGDTFFVGHSVSAMIGMLAELKAPGTFKAHIMIGPSPCYINDGAYIGGFEREDIDSLLDTLESNYLGWASNMAPAIMGVPERPELGEELAASFCRTDPEIARQFARVTFLSDNRKDLQKFEAPTLVIQSSEDLIAPVAVGEYLQRTLPAVTLRVVNNIGHCPHLSAPAACTQAMKDFMAGLDRR